MPFLKTIRHAVVYYGLRACMFSLSRFPRRVALSVGAFFGRIAHRLLKKENRLAHANLQRVYGTALSMEERERIIAHFFVHSGKNVVDLIRSQRKYAEEILPRTKVTGREHLDAAQKACGSVIGVTGHLGNFELLAAYCVSIGIKTGVIGRKLYDDRIDRLVVAARERAGLRQFYTDESPKHILRWLRDRNSLGVLMDTNSLRVRSADIPFFGTPARTPVGQSVLALHTDSAVVPMACVREGDDGYRILFRPRLEIVRTGDEEKDILMLTSACNRALEELIREYPDQWIWIHDRWRTVTEKKG